MKKLLTKTKKAVLLSSAGFFTLVATASAFDINANQDEAYLIQGANKATMTSLVEKVGGDVLHDFSVIQAISAELNATQVEELNKLNPLLRLEKEQDQQTAGFVWGNDGQKGNRIAGFVWGNDGQKGNRIAGFVWGNDGQKGNRIAGFVWGNDGQKGNRIV